MLADAHISSFGDLWFIQFLRLLSTFTSHGVIYSNFILSMFYYVKWTYNQPALILIFRVDSFAP